MVKVFGPMMSHYASGTLTGTAICSSSLRNRRAREAPEAPPPPPAYDYEVTGTLAPDAAGYYVEEGIFQGRPYWARTIDPFFIWYSPRPPPLFAVAVISEVLGVNLPAYWARNFPTPPPGVYLPYGTATGTATVIAP